jgi:hypothetical protein
MNRLATLVLILALAPLARAADEAQPKAELPRPDADGKISLFNGKDLTGWYGDETVFKAENGEIVGKSEKGLKRNEFLKSKYEVGDFRLTLQMKLVPNKENSGIQFRSQPFKGHEMKGYQADAGAGWWGKLYEESARGMLVKDDNEKVVKKEDWNTYEIVAVGHRVLMAINGQQVVDFEDPKGDTKGIFGLQVHSGGPTEVRWKDLKLELNPKAELVTVKR